MTADAGDRQEADAGVVHLAREQLRELRADLVADARGAWSLRHYTRCRDALDDERLDDVADLDVVVVLEADAALEAGLHLATRRP